MNRRSVLIGLAALLALALALAGLHGMRQRHSTGAVAASADYTCPMHPFVSKDRPGACPVCGMDLVRRSSSSVDPRDLPSNRHVYVSPAQQVMANIAVMSVIYKPVFKIIEASGVISYDQSRQGMASAWVDGRIERLVADRVGAAVSTDKPVARLTSPALTGAEEEYLAHFRETSPQDRARALQTTTSPLYEARISLRELGFTDAEFTALERAGRPEVSIPVYAPLNGVVTAKQALEGQYVRAGDPLLTVADLSEVWAELDVYEDEFPYLRTGQQVVVTSRSYPEREFSGKITYIATFLDPSTRTARVRVALPNRQLLLKPDMLVEATIQIPLGTDIVVPTEAVVVTGDRSLVWVQTDPGVFVPREVTTGVRYRYDIQILKGLKKDEVVAANGAYLIDAEAQLAEGSQASETGEQEKAGVMHPGMATGAGSMDDMDMSDMHMGPTTTPTHGTHRPGRR